MKRAPSQIFAGFDVSFDPKILVVRQRMIGRITFLLACAGVVGLIAWVSLGVWNSGPAGPIEAIAIFIVGSALSAFKVWSRREMWPTKAARLAIIKDQSEYPRARLIAARVLQVDEVQAIEVVIADHRPSDDGNFMSSDMDWIHTYARLHRQGPAILIDSRNWAHMGFIFDQADRLGSRIGVPVVDCSDLRRRCGRASRPWPWVWHWGSRR